MSSASAVDTERQPGNEARKLPEGTWVIESSKMFEMLVEMFECWFEMFM